MRRKDDDFELVHGSGNVFRDCGRADAEGQQAKAPLAARIIGILDDDALSRRKAERQTGVSHAEFTLIRRAQLGRFTIDRLMTLLNKLGQQTDVQIDVNQRVAAEEPSVDLGESLDPFSSKRELVLAARHLAMESDVLILVHPSCTQRY